MGAISTFISYTASSMIGTLVGVGAALAGDRLLAGRRLEHERVRSLQAVADRIFHARALRELPESPDHEVRVLAQSEDADRERVAQSVLETRDLIQKVIGQLRPTDPAQRGLMEMHAACLRYLAMEMEQPECYVTHLQDLRRELNHGQHKLKGVKPDLVIREPGSAARIRTDEFARV